MKRWQVTLTAAALVMAFRVHAQTPLLEYHATVRQYQQQINTILVSESDEFKALCEKEDKTFDDLRAIAEMRLTLLQTSAAAQQVQQELEAYRLAFREDHPELDPHPVPRPGTELTEEQKAALAAHRDAVRAKGAELEELLKAASERYAELAQKESKTRQEIEEMLTLRRELIAASDDAAALVEEIQQMITAFREDHPELTRPNQRPVRRSITKVKSTLNAINELNAQIDEMLAADSDEYQALLAKEDKTDEELQRLSELRRELIAQNEDIRNLIRTVDLLKHRLAYSHRKQLRPDTLPGIALPGNPGAGTGQTDGGTD